jgi:hypothetical protein
MTGEKNSKIPKSIRLNSIPKFIRQKLGDEKALKLCRMYDYIHRKHFMRCPHCKKKTTMVFRSTTRDYRCKKCKNITPAPTKIIGYIVPPFTFKSDIMDFDHTTL